MTEPIYYTIHRREFAPFEHKAGKCIAGGFDRDEVIQAALAHEQELAASWGEKGNCASNVLLFADGEFAEELELEWRL